MKYWRISFTQENQGGECHWIRAMNIGKEHHRRKTVASAKAKQCKNKSFGVGQTMHGSP